MRRRVILAGPALVGLVSACLALAAPALAQDAGFDGLWRAAPTTDCSVVGGDGGAVSIAGGVFQGALTQCRMTQPVNVRDMDAQLFDMVCAGEGESFTERALLMRAADGGLILLWDGYAFKYDPCPLDPARGTVTTSRDIGIPD